MGSRTEEREGKGREVSGLWGRRVGVRSEVSKMSGSRGKIQGVESGKVQGQEKRDLEGERRVGVGSDTLHHWSSRRPSSPRHTSPLGRTECPSTPRSRYLNKYKTTRKGCETLLRRSSGPGITKGTSTV